MCLANHTITTTRWRSIGRLVRSLVCCAWLLQLHIVPSAAIVIRVRTIRAPACIRWWRVVRVVVDWSFLLLIRVVRLRIVCRLAVAWWCATERPACAAVWRVAQLTPSPGSDAAVDCQSLI